MKIVLANLTREDMVAIAAYVSAQKPVAAPQAPSAANSSN
jgi:cytochrome c553